jgi:septal ring factor EnvC (AmiA/AmiB activator)
MFGQDSCHSATILNLEKSLSDLLSSNEQETKVIDEIEAVRKKIRHEQDELQRLKEALQKQVEKDQWMDTKMKALESEIESLSAALKEKKNTYQRYSDQKTSYLSRVWSNRQWLVYIIFMIILVELSLFLVMEGTEWTKAWIEQWSQELNAEPSPFEPF